MILNILKYSHLTRRIIDHYAHNRQDKRRLVGVGRCGFRYKSGIRERNRNADLHIFSYGLNLFGLVCASNLGLAWFFFVCLRVFHGRYFYEPQRPYDLSNQLEIVYGHDILFLGFSKSTS